MWYVVLKHLENIGERWRLLTLCGKGAKLVGIGSRVTEIQKWKEARKVCWEDWAIVIEGQGSWVDADEDEEDEAVNESGVGELRDPFGTNPRCGE